MDTIKKLKNPSQAEGIKGLRNYIMEIRACKSKDAENARVNKELASIRKKFHLSDSTKLGGYQRKKYVYKLIYTYLLGYEIDFGHMEAISLIKSVKYSEKYTGYLFVSVLLSEKADLARLLVQSIKDDLGSPSDYNVCLALNFIANIGGIEMAESLAGDVQRLLVAADSSTFIRKKAALGLLRLYRKHPDILPSGEWTHSVIKLLRDGDFSVITALLSLLLSIVPDHTEEYSDCLEDVINLHTKILARLIVPRDYFYFYCNSPWIQVKILRLIQMFPPSDDIRLSKKLVNNVSTILHASLGMNRTINTRNARHAIFFEAIDVVIHLQREVDLIQDIVGLLGKFISSPEANVCYLSYEALCRICHLEYAIPMVTNFEDNIIKGFINEKDTAVRRRALDLLFRICATENSQKIIDALLKFLPHSELIFREELVIKIALMAELYSTNINYYVDTLITVLRTAGDYIADDVWQRLLQVISKNSNIQAHAAAGAVQLLQVNDSAGQNECMVKVAAYLLGEYAGLIIRSSVGNYGSNDQSEYVDIQPIAVFRLLHLKFAMVSMETRLILMNCYAKLAVQFKELCPIFLQVFSNDYLLRNTNVELQQRAMEYFGILQTLTDDNNPDSLANIVFDEMPPFEEDIEIDDKRKVKDKEVTDKRYFERINPENNKLGNESSKSNSSCTSGSAGTSLFDNTEIINALDSVASTGNQRQAKASLGTGKFVDPLADLIVSQPQKSNYLFDLSNNQQKDIFAVTNNNNKLPASIDELDFQIKTNVINFITQKSSVLYEDANIQIGVSIDHYKNLGRLAYYFTNKSNLVYTDCRLSVVRNIDNVEVQCKELKDTIITPGNRIVHPLYFEANAEFFGFPILDFSYISEKTFKTLYLCIPMYISHFCHEHTVTKDEFRTSWTGLSIELEKQQIFKGSRPANTAEAQNLLEAMHMNCIPNIDPNSNNLVGVCILNLGKINSGILLRLEPDFSQNRWRATCRSSRPGVADVIVSMIASAL